MELRLRIPGTTPAQRLPRRYPSIPQGEVDPFALMLELVRMVARR